MVKVGNLLSSLEVFKKIYRPKMLIFGQKHAFLKLCSWIHEQFPIFTTKGGGQENLLSSLGFVRKFIDLTRRMV